MIFLLPELNSMPVVLPRTTHLRNHFIELGENETAGIGLVFNRDPFLLV